MATYFPGYEYDESRKCYFRVRPKHLRNHRNYDDQDSYVSSSPTEAKVTMSHEYSLYHLTQSRRIEMSERAHSFRLLKECLVPSAKSATNIMPPGLTTNSHFEDILLDESGECLATKYLHHGGRLCDISGIKETKSGLSCEHFMQLKLDATASQGYHSMDYATDADMIHFSILLSDKHIFFTQRVRHNLKVGRTATLTKSASFIKFDPKHGEWFKSYYAIGSSEGVAQVYNCNHIRTFTTSAINSDVLSLAFSLQDPLLFTGYRNGSCHVWDTRTGSSPAMTLTEKAKTANAIASSIIDIHPFLDSNFVILNSLNSNLSVWDVRVQRQVLRFHGHVNDYRTCKSLVDKMESFVSAVGSDGNIRCWSIRTGDMLCCLKPDSHEIPHISYTDSLGGTLGKPSLAVAANNSISVYVPKCCITS